MIEFPYQVKDGTVFVHCSTNTEEVVRIQTLLSQIKTICKIVGPQGKTGLRIVRELNCNGSMCAVLSLNEAVFISDEELESILREIKQKQSH